MAALDKDDVVRFEPLKRFINGSKQMKYVAERHDAKEMRTQLEKVGSNLTVRDRKLHWFPRGAWKLVVDQGVLAQHDIAPSDDGATPVGENHHVLNKRRR